MRASKANTNLNMKISKEQFKNNMYSKQTIKKATTSDGRSHKNRSITNRLSILDTADSRGIAQFPASSRQGWLMRAWIPVPLFTDAIAVLSQLFLYGSHVLLISYTHSYAMFDDCSPVFRQRDLVIVSRFFDINQCSIWRAV